MHSTKPQSSFSRIKRGWMKAGESGAHFFGYILFSVLWVIALAPVALVLKLLGKPLLPDFKGDESTWYLEKEKVQPTLESLKRQW